MSPRDVVRQKTVLCNYHLNHLMTSFIRLVFGQRQIKMDVTAARGDKELLSAASALCKDRTGRRFSGLPQLIGLQSESLLRVGIRGNKINKIKTISAKRRQGILIYSSPFGDAVACGLWREKHFLTWTLTGYPQREAAFSAVFWFFLLKPHLMLPLPLPLHFFAFPVHPNRWNPLGSFSLPLYL